MKIKGLFGVVFVGVVVSVLLVAATVVLRRSATSPGLT